MTAPRTGPSSVCATAGSAAADVGGAAGAPRRGATREQRPGRRTAIASRGGQPIRGRIPAEPTDRTVGEPGGTGPGSRDLRHRLTAATRLPLDTRQVQPAYQELDEHTDHGRSRQGPRRPHRLRRRRAPARGAHPPAGHQSRCLGGHPPYRPFWAITKHADIMAIERDNELFISEPRPLLATAAADEWQRNSSRRAWGCARSSTWTTRTIARSAPIGADWFRPKAMRDLKVRVDELAKR